METRSLPVLQSHANEILREHFTGHIQGGYEEVQVLLLYWDKADLPFREEAVELESLFRKRYNFEVAHFPIPASDSYLALDGLIGTFVKTAKTTRSLSIIHYGGHGDENGTDDGKYPAERRCIWAATARDELTDDNSVNWSEIQPKLRHANQDVLLILDCCFASTAARNSRRIIPGNVELLAASSMAEPTPGPGKHRWSFTKAIVKELVAACSQDQPITVSELHHRLASKDGALITTPVHFALSGRKQTITLYPRSPPKSTEGINIARSEIRLHMILRNSLTHDSIDDIVDWLRTNTPKNIVSLQFTEALDQALNLKDFLHSSPEPRSVAGLESFSPRARNEMRTAWDDFNSEITSGLTLLANSSVGFEEVVKSPASDKPLILRFVESFKFHVSTVQRIVERNILQLPIFSARQGLQMGASQTLFNRLGIADALKVRLSTLPSEPPTVRELDDDHVSRPEFVSTSEHQLLPLKVDNFIEEGRVLIEHKYLDERDPQMMQASIEQIRRLVSVLQQAQSLKFRTLRCFGYRADPVSTEKKRYMLLFREPFAGCQPINLFSLLEGHARGVSTVPPPSLGKRFQLAYEIGLALLKWHGTNWLHQSISSFNIVFFMNGLDELDYSEPFLSGFDYARMLGQSSTHRRPEDNAMFDLYRHPDRQGYPPALSHTKKHDIYSFGILLLEIALWTSVSTALRRQVKKQGPICVRREVLQIAPGKVAHDMGEGYEAALLTCIKGELGSETDDIYQSSVMRDFEHKVLQRLQLGLKVDGRL
ncbi:hypothetical protein F4819DRAFT_447793 [Hypoxylon fuscum]|nr:hypothetical protein F4819DRAFT_447793 [Hypoxylon fuscum]